MKLNKTIKSGIVAALVVAGIGTGAAGVSRIWEGKENLKKAESIVETLTGQVSNLDGKVKGLESQSSTLKTERDALIRERADLIAKGNADAKEIEKLNKDIEKLDGEIASLEGTIETLNTEIGTLNRQLSEANVVINGLESELNKANKDSVAMITNICNKVEKLPFEHSNRFKDECKIDRVVVTSAEELNKYLINGYKTIYLANGVYNSNVIAIEGDVTLIGESADKVIFMPATDMDSLFNVPAGASLTISDITIDGNGVKLQNGIYSEGTLNVENVVMKNIFKQTYKGFGIRAFGNVTVKNSTFMNIERVAVHVNGVDGTKLIERNTFIGSGANGNGVQYGVEVERGATASVKYNTFSHFGQVATSDGSTSAAILATTYFDAAKNTEIDAKHNSINDCTFGIYIGYNDKDTTIYNSNIDKINKFNNVGVEFITTQP